MTKKLWLASALSAVLPLSAAAQQATLNLELVFDASGSMAAELGNQAKIDSARRAVEYVVDSLPDAGVHVGFRVFGHEGDNTEAGKSASCSSTALTVPLRGVDKPALLRQAAEYRPTGWTPITLALTEAAADFAGGAGQRNVILLVTDGEESCGGDPCAAAQALAAADARAVVHVVGFGLEPGAARTLQCVPRSTGGLYADARDGDALAAVLLGLIGEEVRQTGQSFAVPASVQAKVQIPAVDLQAGGSSLVLSGTGAGGEGWIQVGAGGVSVSGADTGGQGSVQVGEGGVVVSGADEEGSGSVTVDRDGGITVGGKDGKGGVRIGTGGISVFGQDDEDEDEDDEADTSVSVGAIECKPGTPCLCKAGSICNFACPGGGCEIKCSSGATCTVDCPDGGCKVKCSSGAVCTTNCPPDSCDVKCSSGAICR
jgi:hypothetical protein